MYCLGLMMFSVDYLPSTVYCKTSDNGHSNKRTTSLQWTNCLPPAITCPYISTFLPPTKGQPPNNGQNARPQRVHYSEVPLYCTDECLPIHTYSKSTFNNLYHFRIWIGSFLGMMSSIQLVSCGYSSVILALIPRTTDALACVEPDTLSLAANLNIK